MPLFPWRKLQAGIRGQTKEAAAQIVQQITNIVQATPKTLDEILDGILYERVAAAELTSGIYKSASATDDGIIEIATIAETDTGTDATRAVSPDGLAGSLYGEKVFYIKVVDAATALTTGDGKAYVTVPNTVSGMDLISAHAAVYTAPTAGVPLIQIHNATDGADMLSTVISIDTNEYNSYTAATQPVVNTGHDDVVQGDIIRVDVDVAGTGTKGLDIALIFMIP